MDFDEFERRLNASKASSPKWFIMWGGPPCSEAQISALEDRVGAALPAEYKTYLTRHGGGYIGHINVFSACAESEWYLPERNRLIPPELKFIAVTDDQTGGYYGFKADGLVCSEAMYYWHFEDGDGLVLTAGSFLEFVVSSGLAEL